ncbi:LytR/AlgR family response regulator transcription factor [Algoriphagus chordae]|uniref:LytTR family two component transcriptional regulator n=1 Tax=Algoriphagus chordae TaxID=237019 RepID=A0A2W7R396_9BACT|nr:LytTR family DNA-binding domain-containing protein [Algoriphagus chordae]PZX54974.1 LytTR family two component transcriptional regulator [Algoriphagus chordae]
MIKYIIVDDEPLAHELIEEFCSMLPHMELKKNCYNAMEAMQFLNSSKVDLMFLDLNMPKLKGFDFLKTLSKPPKVIVTTAYKEFALEGYELNVSDYLVKPFSFERFVKAVNKATEDFSTLTHTTDPTEVLTESFRFFVKGDKKYHQVNADDLLYIEAFGNYTKLFLSGEMLISHEKISFYENLLPSTKFLRVHKSFIVPLEKIKLIEGNRIFINEFEIPIGQTYKSVVSRLYNP